VLLALATVDGAPVAASPLAEALRAAGFTESSHGFLKRAVTAGGVGWRPRARSPRGTAPDWLRRAAGATRDEAVWVPPPGLRAKMDAGGEAPVDDVELEDDEGGGALDDEEPESEDEPRARREP
jgi:hypothetical protein